MTTREYLAQDRTAIPWIIEDIVPTGGIFNLYGVPKAGKSMLALGMCEAISQGKPQWLGLSVQQHGLCMYLQLDTPRSIWMDRHDRVYRKTGIYNFDNILVADR